MKLVNWVRFTWDLNELPPINFPLPQHYHIAPATIADAKELRTVVTRSFALDTAWSDALNEVNSMIEIWLQRAFSSERNVCLALRHGLRIIGAVVLFPDDPNHLSPGPCVLVEYRNRGLGTALLGECLQQLRDAGLAQVVALAKANAPVAKFLYPKFKGTATPEDSTPLLAA